MAIGGNIYGHYIQVDVDEDPVGTVCCLYLDALDNVDCGIYQRGIAANKFVGTLTVAGGSDPPYELFWPQTRAEVVERVRRNVPTEKLGGMVIFYNGEANRMECWLPITGQFFALQVELVDVRPPILEGCPSTTHYFFNAQTGEVGSLPAAVPTYNYKIRGDCELDPKDGQFYRTVETKPGEKKRTGEVVARLDAIEET